MKLIRASDAARYHGVSTQTVLRHARRRGVRLYRLGTFWIRACDLHAVGPIVTSDASREQDVPQDAFARELERFT